MKDSYASVKNGELWIYNLHISPFEQGNIFNKDPMRTRKLLVHKQEIRKLIGLVQQKGVTLVPVSIYWDRNKIKLELAIARGKKLYDKRDEIAKKDALRRLQKREEFWVRRKVFCKLALTSLCKDLKFN